MKQEKLKDERKGTLFLILLTFNFGLIAILARFLSFHLTLYQQLYLTIGIAFLFGLVVFRKKLNFGKLTKISKRDWTIIFIRALFGFVIGGALYRQSLTLTKISNVTFIQSIPFTALVGFLLFKEKFTFKKAIYIALAFVGVILIAVNDFSSILIWGKGEVFSLISAFIFSLSFLSRRWISNFLNDQEISMIALFFATIMLFIMSLIFDPSAIPITKNLNLFFFFVLLLLAFINTIDSLLINFGFRTVPPVLASNIMTLEALFALLLAAIFYREVPILKEFIGGIMIVASVIMMNKLEEKEQ